MKKVIFLTALVIAFGSLHAQYKNSKIELGAQAAVIGARTENSTSVQDAGFVEVSDFRTRISWKAGITSRFYLGSNFYLAPELSVLQKGGRVDESFEHAGYKFETTGNVHMTFLELPLHVMAVIPDELGQIFVGLGPSFSYGIEGRAHLDYKMPVDGGNGTPVYMETSETYKLKFDGKADDELSEDDPYIHLRPFEIGASLVGGFQTRKGFVLKAMANYSFSDIEPNYGYDAKNWYFGLGVGYNMKVK